MRRLLRLVWIPAVALTAGACLATQGNVRTLQADIATVRADAARADSLHRAQLAQVALQVAREVGSVADSLRSLNAFLQRFSDDASRFQGDVTLSMHSFGQQLIALQERAGLSQKQIQNLAADLENSRATAAAAVAPAPQLGAAGVAAAAGATGANPSSGDPGPTALIQLAFGQLTEGSATTARAGFQGFLDKYPASDLVSEAWYGIGQTYDYEASYAAADSAYQVVVDKYPKSDRAPTALFKWAMNLRRA
ncbi:MAG: tetratricopeptide repeat protein, partial [Gemmatimonadales bacterium]